jgi:outer membrane translocation and assembly module TamA
VQQVPRKVVTLKNTLWQPDLQVDNKNNVRPVEIIIKRRQHTYLSLKVSHQTDNGDKYVYKLFTKNMNGKQQATSYTRSSSECLRNGLRCCNFATS